MAETTKNLKIVLTADGSQLEVGMKAVVNTIEKQVKASSENVALTTKNQINNIVKQIELQGKVQQGLYDKLTASQDKINSSSMNMALATNAMTMAVNSYNRKLEESINLVAKLQSELSAIKPISLGAENKYKMVTVPSPTGGLMEVPQQVGADAARQDFRGYTKNAFGTVTQKREAEAAAEAKRIQDEFNLVEKALQDTNSRRAKLAEQREKVISQIEETSIQRRWDSQRNFLLNTVEAEDQANKARIAAKRADTIAAFEEVAAREKAQQDAVTKTNAILQDNIAKADAANKARISATVTSYKEETQNSLRELTNKVNLENAIRRFGADSQQAIAVKASIQEQAIRADLANKIASIEQKVASGGMGLAESQREVQAATARATQALIENSKALDDNNKVIDKSKQQHKSLLTHISEVYGMYQLLNTVASATKQLLLDIPKAGMQQERTRASLGAIFGSEEGFKNIKFLEDLSQKAGQYIGDLQEAYTRFAPSAVLAGASQKEVNQIFTDFTKASTVLHFSTDQVKSLYLALEQMYAKTTVQSEEIKKQLGNVLPGAVEIGAQAWAKYTKSADKSVSAFMEAMKKNEVITREFAPRFAEEYRNVFAGPSDEIFTDVSTKLQSNIARVQNMYFGLTTQLYERTKETINDVVKFTASALETLKNNTGALLQIVELLTVSFGIRLAASIVTSFTYLEKAVVLLSGFSVAGLAAVTSVTALVGSIAGLSMAYEENRGILVEYKGLTASVTDVLEVLASVVKDKVVTAYEKLSETVGSFADKVRSGEYSGLGASLLKSLLPAPGQTISDWFFEFTSKFVAAFEATRQYIANSVIKGENFIVSMTSPYGAMKPVDDKSWKEYYSQLTSDFMSASKLYQNDISNGISNIMYEASRKGVEDFITQYKGTSYREMKEALGSISKQPIASLITEQDRRRLFATAKDFAGVDSTGTNEPLPKIDKKAVRDAYREALEEIKNIYAEIRNNIAEALGNIDTLYKSNAISVEDYYSQKRELTLADIAVQREAIQEEIKVAFANKDKVKVAKLNGELLKVQADETKRLTEQTQQRVAAERSLKDILSNIQSDYAKTFGTIVDAADAADAAERKFLAAQGDKILQLSIEADAGNEIAAARLKELYALQDNAVIMEQLNDIETRRNALITDYEAKLQRINNQIQSGTLSPMTGWAMTDEARNQLLKDLEDLQNKSKQAITSRGTGVQLSDKVKQETEKATNYLQDLQTQGGVIANKLEQSFSMAFDNAFTSLAQGTATGKQVFSSFTQAIVADIQKIIAQEIRSKILGSILKPLMNAGFSALTGFVGNAGLLGSGYAGAANGTNISSNASFIGPMKPSANGNVFTGSGIAAYSGSMVTSPTVFPFAKGVGLMGEAGPEAILPLKRNSQGKLGVIAGDSGNSSNNVYNIAVTVQSGKNDSPADTGQKIGEQIIRVIAREEIASARRQGNTLNKARYV